MKSVASRGKKRIKLTPTVNRKFASKTSTVTNGPKNKPKKHNKKQEPTLVATSSTEALGTTSSSEEEVETLRRVTDHSSDDSSINHLITDDFSSNFKTPVSKRSKLLSIDDVSLQRHPRKSKKFSRDRQEKLTPKNLLSSPDMDDFTSGRKGPFASTPVHTHPVTELDFGLSDVTDSEDQDLDGTNTSEQVNLAISCPTCVSGKLKFNPLPSFVTVPQAHKKFLKQPDN